MRNNVKEAKSTISDSILYSMTGLDENNLLLFDAGRNLTWSGSSCACDPIEGSQGSPRFSDP
jgi:hypothetical protein